MPRIPRGLVDGFIYHVINRGNGRQKVFHKEQDYEAFINLMEEAKGRHPVKILAYCLIPNHFHMVLMKRKKKRKKGTGCFWGRVIGLSSRQRYSWQSGIGVRP